MNDRLRRGLYPLLMLLILPWAGAALSQAADDAAFTAALARLNTKDLKAITEAATNLGALGDPRALPVLDALGDRRLVVAEDSGRVLIRGPGDVLIDPVGGAPVAAADLAVRTLTINNAVRRALKLASAGLQLTSPDAGVRLGAARALAQDPQEDTEPALRAALAAETDTSIREALTLALAQIDLSSKEPARRLAAINHIGETGQLSFRPLLEPLVANNPDGSHREPDEATRKAALQAIAAIDNWQLVVGQAANLFYGLSLGSVLLLAALGLAITFGLMGVINMAHGEMLMLGAYATFVVQNLFRAYLPDLFDAYLLAAIPVAFLVSGAVGVVMERTIICHLYGRPLETLLATWGISLLLIQTVRLIFGAQNVEVANPGWLSGGVLITPGLVLTYNRIAAIVFAALVLAAVWLLLQRTALGLNVRAVTQNRPIASALGINTPGVDMWTFGLGCGVAGLGGVALSQLGNVGPELGQGYIVDSFMVVVLGGVGKLAGTAAGAMILGLINKFLEPTMGAVLGKIMVLIFIILFIQKRPQGIFALRGRGAEV